MGLNRLVVYRYRGFVHTITIMLNVGVVTSITNQNSDYLTLYNRNLALFDSRGVVKHGGISV